MNITRVLLSPSRGEVEVYGCVGFDYSVPSAGAM